VRRYVLTRLQRLAAACLFLATKVEEVRACPLAAPKQLCLQRPLQLQALNNATCAIADSDTHQ